MWTASENEGRQEAQKREAGCSISALLMVSLTPQFMAVTQSREGSRHACGLSARKEKAGARGALLVPEKAPSSLREEGGRMLCK